MSGPVRTDEAPSVPASASPGPAGVEITDSRDATVAGTRVRRALPQRLRRSVGAWCFADHLGPADVTEDAGPDVGPHPHIGLQTVTWLLDGRLLHRDSLGSEQPIRPGQLNLMTAGGGVAHAEESVHRHVGVLEGVQLWVAQPDATRQGQPAFEHHADLPAFESGRATATVLVGELDGVRSPARHDTPLVGVDVDLPGGAAALPLRPEWEYAVVVLRGAVSIDGQAVVPGRLAYLGRGRDELGLEAREPSRALLLGGEPFGEPILMWWNFVGRDRGELEAAYRSWHGRDDRFGRVASELPRIPAPEPYWLSRQA